MRGAREQLERAIELDGSNAAAHAGLADVIRYLGWLNVDLRPRAEWDRESRRSAARAIELDPDLADAHCSLGIILWDDYEWAAAEREFRAALASNPSSSWAHRNLSSLLACRSRLDEAILEGELATASDPLSLTNLEFQMSLLCWANRLDEAKIIVDRMRRIDPVHRLTLVATWRYCLHRKDLAGVREATTTFGERNPVDRLEGAAWTFAATGEADRAREAIHELEIRQGPGNRVFPFTLAGLYARIGDLDECFRLANIALDQLALPIQYWQTDPSYANLRADPRYTLLLKRQKLA
jgi:Tfp pilus assembly protein PilF